MRKPNRLSLALRELVCWLFDHDWQPFARHSETETVTGRLCVRCGEAEAHRFKGRYPQPRPLA